MSISLGDTMTANTHKMEIICSSFDSLLLLVFWSLVTFNKIRVVKEVSIFC